MGYARNEKETDIDDNRIRIDGYTDYCRCGSVSTQIAVERSFGWVYFVTLLQN